MHRYGFILLLLCLPLYSQDSATVERDIRSAMAHSLFRSQPITVSAAISLGEKQVGTYRLIWNSNEDWADRVDIGERTSLTLARGNRQYHKRNTPADNPWAGLVENAFEPQQLWHDGSEWSFIKSSKSKVDDVPCECGEFESKQKNRLRVCISVARKELMSISSPKIDYSNFIDWNGGRYPKRFTVLDSKGDNGRLLTVTIGSFGVNGKVPEPEAGMEESVNCAPSAVSGGQLKQRIPPTYPGPALMGRIQGAVYIDAEIRTDGSVNIKSATGHPMLADAAKAAVSGWKYKPYSCSGTPIAMPTVITVNFSLVGF
jgi:TonB family protein